MRRAVRVGAAAVMLVSFAGTPSTARQPGSVEGGSEDRQEYALHRFDEDYRFLSDPAQRTDPWDPIKRIPLNAGGDAYLSLGGETRTRFEHVRNPDFRLAGGPDDDAYLLNRTLFHADLHLGSRVRVFGQVGSYGAIGADASLGPLQENDVDLAQAFAEASFDFGRSSDNLTLRAGRQELSFGNYRLVSVREGPNVRQAFDGVRLFWRSDDEADAARIDAFVTRPVLSQEGAFDDRSNEDRTFWGVYGTAPVGSRVPGLNVDFYYLGTAREAARFVDGDGREVRHTVGLRLFGESRGWDWDVEAARQFGSLGAADIDAGTVAVAVGRTFGDLPSTPRLGLTANLASGDRRRRDGKLGTFNPLFPSLPYYSEAALIFPANIMDVKPEIGLKPSSNLAVSFEWDFLWRHRADDAFYAPPLALIDGTTGPGRAIGSQAQLRAAWAASRHVQVLAAYVHFKTGESLRRVGGRDVDFILLSAAYRF